MTLPRTVLIRPSQALLFAPAVLLLLAAIILTRNFCSRPVIHAKDFSDRGHAVAIYLEYPPAYPFSGDVRVVLEVHQISGNRTVLEKSIGTRRWASEAVAAFYTIEWPEQELIVLHSRDGTCTHPVRIRPIGEEDDDPAGDGRGARNRGHRSEVTCGKSLREQ